MENKKIQTNLTVTNEVFIDDAGNEMPFVAFTMSLSEESFKLVPLKKDKKLLLYLIKRHKLLVDGRYETKITLSQEQFRDNKTRKVIDYVAYTVALPGRDFRLIVRDDDKLLVKYLLEADYGFFIDDNVEIEEEVDED